MNCGFKVLRLILVLQLISISYFLGITNAYGDPTSAATGILGFFGVGGNSEPEKPAPEKAPKEKPDAAPQLTGEGPQVAWQNAINTCMEASAQCQTLKTECENFQEQQKSLKKQTEAKNAASIKKLNTDTESAAAGTKIEAEDIKKTNANYNAGVESLTQQVLQACQTATSDTTTCNKNGDMQEKCSKIDGAIKQAKAADKKEEGSVLSDILGGTGDILSKAMSAAQLADLVNKLAGCKGLNAKEEEKCRDKERDAYCEEPPGSGNFVQKIKKVKEIDGKICRLDKPPDAKESPTPPEGDEKQEQKVAGVKAEGDVLGAKEKQDKDKVDPEVAGTDIKEDPRDPSKTGAAASGGRNTGSGGGFGGQGGFRPAGVVSDSKGRENFKGRDRSGRESDVSFGGDGGRGGYGGRQPTDSGYDVDSGRLAKRSRPTPKEEKTALAQPTPEASLFERVETTYSNVRPQLERQ